MNKPGTEAATRILIKIHNLTDAAVGYEPKPTNWWRAIVVQVDWPRSRVSAYVPFEPVQLCSTSGAPSPQAGRLAEIPGGPVPFTPSTAGLRNGFAKAPTVPAERGGCLKIRRLILQC